MLTLRASQFAEPTDLRDVTWPYLRDVAQAADGACNAIRERGRLLAEVHANAVRGESISMDNDYQPVADACVCSQGFALWVRSIEPLLPELRKRYAACGCGFITATLLRRVRSEACISRGLRSEHSNAHAGSRWLRP